MPKTVLVTGANGQVGGELRRLIEQKHLPDRFLFTDKESLDITDQKAVERFITQNGVTHIVNCAAYTDVDGAEENEEAAFAVNRDGVKNLAEAAKAHDIRLIHISTDYVFDGTGHTPLKEDDTVNPQGVYARSKHAGEEAILQIAPKGALIIRTSWIYSALGHNFVKTMLRLAKERDTINVVDDQIGTPTYAADLAEAILQVLQSDRFPEGVEIYHFSNEGNCSWYDFAQAVFELSGTKCRVNPIPTSAYPTPAKRPAYSVLSKEKIKRDYNLTIPYWREALKRCLQQLERPVKRRRIGVVGSGFIANGLAKMLLRHPELTVSKVLTRSDISRRTDFVDPSLLTHDLTALIQESDLIVECSGDAVYATEVIDTVLKAGLPVVTMNSEFHVTTGSYFVGKGMLTEADGDQPGVLAALHEEALAMGFKPVLYANIKGFLNENPTREEMEYWGARSNLSLEMVTSFTDGTKVQIEQVLVANGLGANLIQEGLVKLKSDDMLEGGTKLVEIAKEKGVALPVSDYVLSPKLPAGVFILAEHEEEQKGALRYYKLGEGPYYVIERTYHLCHMEIIKTIQRVLNGGGVLLDNSPNPRYSVAAVAKRDIAVGETLKKAIGSFTVRGEGVEIARHPDHVPIGLLADAEFVKPLKAGETVTFDHVRLPDSLALEIWRNIAQKACQNA